MEIIKVKEKYERKLNHLLKNISDYESSKNQEFIFASKTLKLEAEELIVVVDALRKQIPMKAYCREYEDEFICPNCGYEEDGCDVITIKVCPNCGQKIKWD